MNTKIIVQVKDLKKLDKEGYFYNLDLPLDFTVDRIVDRTYRLNERFVGNTVLVTTYNFSLDDLEKNKDLCSLIITSKPLEKFKDSIPQFIVKDIYQLMFSLAEIVRKQYKNPIIGITGSAGKSTTSKMLWRLIKDNQTDALTNLGNHNDRHSVPYYLSNLIRNPDYAVLEISADSLLKEKRFGNLAELANLDIGIVTTIGGAHLSKYRDNLNVAKIKSGLVEGIKKGGTLIINQDIGEEELNVFIQKARIREIQVLTYSLKDINANAYLISKSWQKDHMQTITCVNNFLTSYELTNGSDGVIQNSLGVLLALKTLGIELTNERLQKFKFVHFLPRVLEKKRYKVGNASEIQIIDDTHNASIPSMLNTIEYFKFLAESDKYRGNKILILARVADLGSESQKLHQQFLKPIASAKADYVFLYGPQMKPLMKQLRKEKILVYHYSDLDELIEETVELLKDDSMVVMKGSRSESDFEQINKRLPNKIIESGGKLIS